jgi:hypothetical protein
VKSIQLDQVDQKKIKKINSVPSVVSVASFQKARRKTQSLTGGTAHKWAFCKHEQEEAPTLKKRRQNPET